MSERTLSSIETIVEVNEIPDADLIEAVRVRNWTVVVKKGQFVAGDEVLYIEVDAALPLDDPRFAFLGARSTKRFTGDIGIERDVHVLKTARLRGVYSQGIVFPLADFPELTAFPPQMQPDHDEILGIEKWEPPLPPGMAAIAPFPPFLRKTAVERVQNIDAGTWATIQADRDAWRPIEKLDGQSLTAWKTLDGELHVASRCWELDPARSNPHWEVAKRVCLTDLLEPGEWLQAEVAGPGLQHNPLGLDSLRLFVFGFGTTDFISAKRLPTHQWRWAKDFAAPIVPHMVLPDTIEETIVQVEKFKSTVTGKDGEGVVWTHRDGIGLPGLDGRHVWKALSARYLLKHDR
jgi:RNA ligase (TIGR02306 family)